MNGGSCIEDGDKFKCVCLPWTSGSMCEGVFYWHCVSYLYLVYFFSNAEADTDFVVLYPDGHANFAQFFHCYGLMGDMFFANVRINERKNDIFIILKKTYICHGFWRNNILFHFRKPSMLNKTVHARRKMHRRLFRISLVVWSNAILLYLQATI